MTQGTREWAETNFNFQKGCRNDCTYCYAKATAIRFGTATPEGWKTPVVSMPEHYPHGKSVMFPSSHDISSANVDKAIECLTELLKRDNHVLIVTKAQASAVNSIIHAMDSPALSTYKDKVAFRVTIGTADEVLLRRFEPGAPDFHERFMAFRSLFMAGFKTSVSAEPLLGGIDTFNDLYLRVKRYVTDTIWVGVMNMPRQRIHMNTTGTFDESLIDWIIKKQSPEEMYRLYQKYKDDEMVSFKDSIIDIVKKRENQ